MDPDSPASHFASNNGQKTRTGPFANCYTNKMSWRHKKSWIESTWTAAYVQTNWTKNPFP